MKRKTVDIARDKWKSILVELGIPEKHLVNRHGPCPVCQGSDRFRWDNRNGDGTYFCSGCGAGNGMKLAMEWTGLSFRDCAARVDQICEYAPADTAPTVTDADRALKTRRRLLAISAGLQPVGDLDPVARYLRSRGIKRIPKSHLRYHPKLAYYDGGFQGNYPAMVAAFRRPGGEVETFHITYLTADGHKADVRSARKVVGVQQGLAGCAIRLTDVAEHIGIAEGIETALSVTELYGVPCWASYSANSLETFQPPEGVKSVTIYPDADANFTGQAAAAACAKRLAFAGYDVAMPEFPKVGNDYNDILMEAAQ